MNRRISPLRRLVSFSILIALALSFVIARTAQKYIPHKAELTFENKSDQVITAMDVKLCDQSQKTEMLPVGQTTRMDFIFKLACPYQISLTLADGSILRTRAGFLKPDHSYQDVITIENGNFIHKPTVLEWDFNTMLILLGSFGVCFGAAYAVLKRFIPLSAER